MQDWFVPIRADFRVERDGLAKMRAALESADERVRVRDLSVEDGPVEGTLVVTAETGGAAKALARATIERSLPHGSNGRGWEIGDPPEWVPED
jgi:hypothetical protein